VKLVDPRGKKGGQSEVVKKETLIGELLKRDE
jgi:hypothetical protein